MGNISNIIGKVKTAKIPFLNLRQQYEEIKEEIDSALIR